MTDAATRPEPHRPVDCGPRMIHRPPPVRRYSGPVRRRMGYGWLVLLAGLLAAVALVVLAFSRPVAGMPAPSDCRLGLLMAHDMSGSVGQFTLRQTFEDTADVIETATIRDALVSDGGVYYAAFAWDSRQRDLMDWRPIRSVEEVAALAAEYRALSNTFMSYGGGTNMLGAWERAAEIFGRIQCDMYVLDVITDGTPDAKIPGLMAVQRLAGDLFDPGLHQINILYVRGNGALPFAVVEEHLPFGIGSFAIEVPSFDFFAAALYRKLLLEVACRADCARPIGEDAL